MPNRFFPGYPVHRVDWGFEIVHIIFWALLLTAIVALVVWAVNASRHGGLLHEHPAPPRSSTDVALHEARMRYARGEMTRDEFLQVSTDLGGPATVPSGPPEPPAEG